MRSDASARLFCPQWLPRELVRASCQVNRRSLTCISCMADLCLYERCGTPVGPGAYPLLSCVRNHFVSDVLLAAL